MGFEKANETSRLTLGAGCQGAWGKSGETLGRQLEGEKRRAGGRYGSVTEKGLPMFSRQSVSPTVTYVKRNDGQLEKQLHDALNERGQLCLVTGPSKTGKTTLYREVLDRRNELPLVSNATEQRR